MFYKIKMLGRNRNALHKASSRVGKRRITWTLSDRGGRTFRLFCSVDNHAEVKEGRSWRGIRNFSNNSISEMAKHWIAALECNWALHWVYSEKAGCPSIGRCWRGRFICKLMLGSQVFSNVQLFKYMHMHAHAQTSNGEIAKDLIN